MASANECWDSGFTSRFMSLSYAPTAGFSVGAAMPLLMVVVSPATGFVDPLTGKLRGLTFCNAPCNR